MVMTCCLTEPDRCWSTIIKSSGTINLGSTCDSISGAFQINRRTQKSRNAKHRIVASKKRTLSDLIHHGDHWIQTIATHSEAQRREVLLEVWGLGPWSVAMWELFVTQSNQWSDKDLILRRLSVDFAAELGEDARDFVARALPYRSYLALYCWRFHDQNRH